MLGYRERMELAAVALVEGIPYVGADFRLDPPEQGQPLGAHARRDRDRQAHREDRGRRLRGSPGGPPRTRSGRRRDGPRRAAGARSLGRLGPDLDRLLALVAAGEHAASDYLEDAVTTGVTTVGARRAGGSPARRTSPTSGRPQSSRPPRPGPRDPRGERGGDPAGPGTRDPRRGVDGTGRVPGRLPGPVPLAVGSGGCYDGHRPIRVREPFRAPYPCPALPGRRSVHRRRTRTGPAGRDRGKEAFFTTAPPAVEGYPPPRSRSWVHGRRVERAAGRSRRSGRRPRCRPGIRRPPHGTEGGGGRHGSRQEPSTEGRRSCSWTTARKLSTDPSISTPRSAARSTSRWLGQEASMTRDKTPHHDLRPGCCLPYSKG